MNNERRERHDQRKETKKLVKIRKRRVMCMKFLTLTVGQIKWNKGKYA